MVVRTGFARNWVRFVGAPPGCHEDVAETTADPLPYRGCLALNLHRLRLVPAVVEEAGLSGSVCMKVCVSVNMHRQ